MTENEDRGKQSHSVTPSRKSKIPKTDSYTHPARDAKELQKNHKEEKIEQTNHKYRSRSFWQRSKIKDDGEKPQSDINKQESNKSNKSTGGNRSTHHRSMSKDKENHVSSKDQKGKWTENQRKIQRSECEKIKSIYLEKNSNELKATQEQHYQLVPLSDKSSKGKSEKDPNRNIPIKNDNRSNKNQNTYKEDKKPYSNRQKYSGKEGKVEKPDNTKIIKKDPSEYRAKENGNKEIIVSKQVNEKTDSSENIIIEPNKERNYSSGNRKARNPFSQQLQSFNKSLQYQCKDSSENRNKEKTSLVEKHNSTNNEKRQCLGDRSIDKHISQNIYANRAPCDNTGDRSRSKNNEKTADKLIENLDVSENKRLQIKEETRRIRNPFAQQLEVDRDFHGKRTIQMLENNNNLSGQLSRQQDSKTRYSVNKSSSKNNYNANNILQQAKDNNPFACKSNFGVLTEENGNNRVFNEIKNDKVPQKQLQRNRNPGKRNYTHKKPIVPQSNSSTEPKDRQKTHDVIKSSNNRNKVENKSIENPPSQETTEKKDPNPEKYPNSLSTPKILEEQRIFYKRFSVDDISKLDNPVTGNLPPFGGRKEKKIVPLGDQPNDSNTLDNPCDLIETSMVKEEHKSRFVIPKIGRNRPDTKASWKHYRGAANVRQSEKFDTPLLKLERKLKQSNRDLQLQIEQDYLKEKENTKSNPEYNTLKPESINEPIEKTCQKLENVKNIIPNLHDTPKLENNPKATTSFDMKRLDLTPQPPKNVTVINQQNENEKGKIQIVNKCRIENQKLEEEMKKHTIHSVSKYENSSESQTNLLVNDIQEKISKIRSKSNQKSQKDEGKKKISNNTTQKHLQEPKTQNPDKSTSREIKRGTGPKQVKTRCVERQHSSGEQRVDSDKNNKEITTLRQKLTQVDTLKRSNRTIKEASKDLKEKTAQTNKKYTSTVLSSKDPKHENHSHRDYLKQSKQNENLGDCEIQKVKRHRQNQSGKSPAPHEKPKEQNIQPDEYSHPVVSAVPEKTLRKEESLLMNFAHTEMDNAELKHLDGETSSALIEDVDTFGDDLEMLAEIIRCKNEELRQLEQDIEESNRSEREAGTVERISETIKQLKFKEVQHNKSVSQIQDIKEKNEADQKEVESELINDDIRELEEAIRLKNEELRQLEEAIEKKEEDDKLKKCKNMISKDNSSDVEISGNKIPTQYHPLKRKHEHMETGLNMVKFFNEETLSFKDKREEQSCHNKLALYKLPKQNQRRENTLTFPQKFNPFPHNPFAFKTRPTQFNPYVCVPMRKDIRTLSGMQSVCDRNRFFNVNPIKTQMPTFGYLQFKKTDVVPYNVIPVSQQKLSIQSDPFIQNSAQKTTDFQIVSSFKHESLINRKQFQPFSIDTHFRKMDDIIKRRKAELKRFVKAKKQQDYYHKLCLNTISKNAEKRKSLSYQKNNSQLLINNYLGGQNSARRKNDELKLIETNEENNVKMNVASNEKSNSLTLVPDNIDVEKKSVQNNHNSTKVQTVNAQSVQNPLCQLVKGIEKDNLNDIKPSLEVKIEKIQDQPLKKESAKNCVKVSAVKKPKTVLHQSQNINKVQKENEMKEKVYENNAFIEKSKSMQIIKKADVIQKKVNIQKSEKSSSQKMLKHCAASNDIRISKLLEDDLKIKNNNDDLFDEGTLLTQDKKTFQTHLLKPKLAQKEVSSNSNKSCIYKKVRRLSISCEVKEIEIEKTIRNDEQKKIEADVEKKGFHNRANEVSKKTLEKISETHLMEDNLSFSLNQQEVKLRKCSNFLGAQDNIFPKIEEVSKMEHGAEKKVISGRHKNMQLQLPFRTQQFGDTMPNNMNLLAQKPIKAEYDFDAALFSNLTELQVFPIDNDFTGLKDQSTQQQMTKTQENKFYQNNSLNDFPICKEIEFNAGAFIKLKEIQVFPIANEDVENMNGKSINPSSLEIIPEPKMINDPCVRKSDINLSVNEDLADQAIRKNGLTRNSSINQKYTPKEFDSSKAQIVKRTIFCDQKNMRRLSLSSNIEELEETIRLKTEELKQLEVEIARSSLNKEVSNEHQQKIPENQAIDKFTKSKEKNFCQPDLSLVSNKEPNYVDSFKVSSEGKKSRETNQRTKGKKKLKKVELQTDMKPMCQKIVQIEEIQTFRNSVGEYKEESLSIKEQPTIPKETDFSAELFLNRRDIQVFRLGKDNEICEGIVQPKIEEKKKPIDLKVVPRTIVTKVQKGMLNSQCETLYQSAVLQEKKIVQCHPLSLKTVLTKTDFKTIPNTSEIQQSPIDDKNIRVINEEFKKVKCNTIKQNDMKITSAKKQAKTIPQKKPVPEESSIYDMEYPEKKTEEKVLPIENSSENREFRDLHETNKKFQKVQKNTENKNPCKTGILFDEKSKNTHKPTLNKFQIERTNTIANNTNTCSNNSNTSLTYYDPPQSSNAEISKIPPSEVLSHDRKVSPLVIKRQKCEGGQHSKALKRLTNYTVAQKSSRKEVILDEQLKHLQKRNEISQEHAHCAQKSIKSSPDSLLNCIPRREDFIDGITLNQQDIDHNDNEFHIVSKNNEKTLLNQKSNRTSTQCDSFPLSPIQQEYEVPMINPLKTGTALNQINVQSTADYLKPLKIPDLPSNSKENLLIPKTKKKKSQSPKKKHKKSPKKKVLCYLDLWNMKKENKLYNGKPIEIPPYLEDNFIQRDLKKLKKEKKRKESMAIDKVSAVVKCNEATQATNQPILPHEVHHSPHGETPKSSNNLRLSQEALKTSQPKVRTFSRGKDLSILKEICKPQEKKENEIEKIVKFLEDESKDFKEVDKNVQSKNLDELLMPIEKITVNNKRPNENPQSSDNQIKKRKLSSCEDAITNKDNSKLEMKLNNKSTIPSDKTEEEENTTKDLVKKKVESKIDQKEEMKEKSTVEERVVNDKGNQNISKTAEINANIDPEISANLPILSELIKVQETTTSSLKENNHKIDNEKSTENIGETTSKEKVSLEIDKTVAENVEKDHKTTSSAPTEAPSILKQASEEELAEEAEIKRLREKRLKMLEKIRETIQYETIRFGPPESFSGAKGGANDNGYRFLDIHEVLQNRMARKGKNNNGKLLKVPMHLEKSEMLPHLSDEDVVDLEEVAVLDTYQTYKPNKLNGDKSTVFDHPNKVIEQATLSSAQLPNLVKEMSLTEKYKYANRLSEVQLEALEYACQAHEQLLPNGERGGFLLGDGPGMGKGRTLVALIYENYKQRRKRSLWISMSEECKYDVERDLIAVGVSTHIKVAPLSRFQYRDIASDDDDVDGNSSEGSESFKKGIICCSYAELIAESPFPGDSRHSSHVTQLAEWLGNCGLIVFDECHKANVLSLTSASKFIRTCTLVLQLQQLLPLARVVYASATGAAEPRNMVYMTRLGLWGEGSSYAVFQEFISAMEKRGSGAVDCMAADMKMRGIYLARHLSYENINFQIKEVPMTREFHKFYNYSADLWAKIYEQVIKACRRLCIDCRAQERITRRFWSSHTRYFKHVCLAAKQKHMVFLANEILAKDQAVVIGLHATGDCGTLDDLVDDESEEPKSFISTARSIIQSFMDNLFPAPSKEFFDKLSKDNAFYPESVTHPLDLKRARMDSDWSDEETEDEDDEEEEQDDEQLRKIPIFGRKRRRQPIKVKKSKQQRILKHFCNSKAPENDDKDFKIDYDTFDPMVAKITEPEVMRCISAREKFVVKIQQMRRRMPPNTLDKLISKLGGSEQVAEISLRRSRLLKRTTDETYEYEMRGQSDAQLDELNMQERQSFVNNSKRIAIITEAASCGISLVEPNAVNPRKVQHFCLELPWSTDRAVQQLGRSKRSQQQHNPEYVILVSNLAMENYQASMLAMQLKQLGAVESVSRAEDEKGARNEQLLFNVHSSIGFSALDSLLQQISGKKPLENDLVPKSYEGNFLYDSCDALSGVGILTVGLNNTGQRTYIIDTGCVNVTTFLNRILGCRIEIQNALFKFFINKLKSLILQTRRNAHFDLGIVDLDVHGGSVSLTKQINFRRNSEPGTAATELRTVTVERGMSFEAAIAEYKKEERQYYEGFYILESALNNVKCAILCLSVNYELKPDNMQIPNHKNCVQLRICRPNIGFQLHTESLIAIRERYTKTLPELAQELWDRQYQSSLNSCAHNYWNSKCNYGKKCYLGLRRRSYHVLSGLIESIWERIAEIIEKYGRQMQMVRFSLNPNRKVVGVVVTESAYRRIVAVLSRDFMVESRDYK